MDFHFSRVMLGHCVWVSVCSVMARTDWLGHKLKPENEILHVKMMSAKFLLGKGMRKKQVEGRGTPWEEDGCQAGLQALSCPPWRVDRQTLSSVGVNPYRTPPWLEPSVSELESICFSILGNSCVF